VIDSLSVQYTLFRPDGTPVRAMAKLSLTQVEKAVDKPSAGGSKKGQNPTTRGLADLRSHVVRDGDTLPSIAFTSYGDPTRWRAIAEANGIDDPLALRRGRLLSVPQVDA
jgi:nucleoid-associated protein YgaU